MFIEMTENQRNNILGLLVRVPKLPNESSFDFAKALLETEALLTNPIPKPSKPELVEPVIPRP